MRKVSVIIPHHCTWRWTATCLWHFKQFGIPVESELILVDNSPGDPSMLAITETELGEGVTLVRGDPNFTSHGRGYEKGYERATGDWIFTSETDSFPTQHGWFDPYVKASPQFDLIGPEIPMAAGRYIHPAGTLVSRHALERQYYWQERANQWVFCPSAAETLGTSDRPYHVVAHQEWLAQRPFKDDLAAEIDTWNQVGPWQEMRHFSQDSFATYNQRERLNLEIPPEPGYFNTIGLEAGQHLSSFVQSIGLNVYRAPTHIEWMPGRAGQQAAYSTVLNGFTHVWCGTVSNLKNDIDPQVREHKLAQMDAYFSRLPLDLRRRIEELEKKHAAL